MKCSLVYMDFEGRSDGRSIKSILGHVAPLKLVCDFSILNALIIWSSYKIFLFLSCVIRLLSAMILNKKNQRFRLRKCSHLLKMTVRKSCSKPFSEYIDEKKLEKNALCLHNFLIACS